MTGHSTTSRSNTVLTDLFTQHHYRHVYVTKPELVAAVDNWIYFYNTVRRHFALGMLSPDNYEKSQAAA